MTHSMKATVLCAALFCLTFPFPGQEVRAEWGGFVSGSAASSRMDSTTSTAYDQQYTLYTNGQPTSTIRYSLSGFFRHLQSHEQGEPFNWSTEVRPTGALNWSSRVLTVRGDATYRTDRDELGTTKLTDRSASVNAQTSWVTWPQLFVSGNWAKNVNDLDLLGYDTRSRTYSAGGNYSGHRIFANYEYSDLLTRNPEQQVDRVSRSHNGRLDLTRSLLKRVLHLQAGYQIASRTEEERSAATGESLIPLPTAAGLYAADLSPELDALESVPALVDGLLDIAASDEYDLVNGSAHNFGLDFATTVTVDHVYLYVDTLEAGTLNWSVWRSFDNLNWIPVAQNVQGLFNRVNLRYEFQIPATETRYLKLVVAPQLLNTPVMVTEMRGFVTRVNEQGTSRSTDHRGSARIQIQPARWLSLDASGDVLRQDQSQSALAREEDGLQSSLRFDRARVLQTVLRYSRSRSAYTDRAIEETVTETASGILRSTWSRALGTTATLERTEEWQSKARSRRKDHARFEINALLLPALRLISQLSYAEDERLQTGDVIISRSLTTAFEGEPTYRSQLTISHRYETQSARFSAVRKYRYSVGGRLNYRLTDTINLTGSAQTSEDPSRTDRSYDALFSWLPTHKLSFGGSFNRIEGNLAENANQYSLQAVFYWTTRTELSGSYALNEREGEATTYSSRVSLLSRF